MADRVRPLKIESPASGGTELDEFPVSANPQVDHVDTRGLFIQNDTSDDEDVHITRDASSPDNMTFKDEVQTTPVTLTQLLGGISGLTDDTVTRADGATAVQNSAWFINDAGKLYTSAGDLEVGGDSMFGGPASGNTIKVTIGAGAVQTSKLLALQDQNANTALTLGAVRAKTEVEIISAPSVAGTAQAGGASAITLAAGEPAQDDYYASYAIEITSGTGVGQIRSVSAYDGATKIATVSVAWTTTPDATSQYELTLVRDLLFRSRDSGSSAEGSFKFVNDAGSLMATISAVAADRLTVNGNINVGNVTANDALFTLTGVTSSEFFLVENSISDVLLKLTGDNTAQVIDCTISADNEVVIPSANGDIGLTIGTGSYPFQMGLDSGGTAFIRRGIAGALRFMDGANYPQILAGNNTSDTGSFFIDTQALSGTATRQIRLNTLGGVGSAPVVIGRGGCWPETDAIVPLGDASYRWQRAHLNHLVSDVDVDSGTASLDDATFVIAQAGTYTLTLPTAAKGWWYVIERQGTTGVVTLAPDSGDTINGGSSIALDYDTTFLVFAEDATDWRLVALSSAALSDTAPVNVTKATAAAGSASEAARQDHKHDVTTAIAGASTPGDTAAEGSATSVSRSDHKHSLPAFGSGSGTFCEGNDSRLSPSLPEYGYAESEGESNNTTATYSQKVRLSFTPTVTGNYLLTWSALMTGGDDEKMMKYRVQQDDTTTLREVPLLQLPKNVQYSDYGVEVSGQKLVTLTASTTYDFDLDYAESDTDPTATVYIKEARLAIRSA